MAEYYGINEKPEFEGLSTYRSPLVYELSGRKFDFVMDDGKKYHFDFLSGTRVEWGLSGKQGSAKIDRYECLKCDDRTYLVNMEVEGAEPRMGLSVVIDDEQKLVTMVFVRQGAVRRYPYLITQDIVFGAIAVPGKALNTARHAYTTNLTGKRIHWHYSSDTEIIHVYYSDNYMRIDFPKERPEGFTPRPDIDFDQFPYDEPTSYVKIKEGVYLVVCNEENKAKRGKTGNNMLFVEDLRRVRDVGRSFGLNRDYRPENYMFSAYGSFVKSDGVIESRSNPYID